MKSTALLITLVVIVKELQNTIACIENCECGFSAEYGDYVSCSGWKEKILPKVESSLFIEDSNLGIITGDMLQNLAQLKTLRLHRCNISKIEPGAFKNLTKLIELDLNFNKLNSLGSGFFRGMRSLKTLKVSSNHISRIGENVFTKDIPQIGYIDASNNKIETLSKGLFNNLPEVTDILLNKNSISFINVEVFKNTPKLESLIMSNNKLQSVNKAAIGEFHCIKIDFSSNKIQYIQDFAFTGIDELNSLFLQNNKMLKIEENTFGELPELNILNIGANRITYIAVNAFENLIELRNINLRSNEISDISLEIFGNLNNIRTIDLENNALETANIDLLGHLLNLQTINLNENPISTVRYKQISGIKAVYLDDNDLTGDCQTLSSLYKLVNGSKTSATTELVSPEWLLGIPVSRYINELSFYNEKCKDNIPCFYDARVKCSNIRKECPVENNNILCTCYYDFSLDYFSCTENRPCDNTITRSCNCPENACRCENIRCFNRGRCVGENDNVRCDCTEASNGTYCEQLIAQKLTVAEEEDSSIDGKTVGIIILVIAIIVLLVVLAWILYKYKQSKRQPKYSTQPKEVEANRYISQDTRRPQLQGHYEINEEDMANYESLQDFQNGNYAKGGSYELVKE